MTVSQPQKAHFSHLSPHPTASFKELLNLSLPLILTALSSSLLGFFDRLLLSHFSISAWNAASTAIYVCFLYQVSCSMIAIIAQTFIGQNIGAKKAFNVGPIVWQMIWFSFLSMIVTYPSSFLAEYYFIGTEVESLSLDYFKPMALFNFLFPLGAALSAFFIGRGKSQVIFFANLSIQLLNVVLDIILIFGIHPYIPPMGTKGAAYATIISQICLCLILYFLFNQKKYAEKFKIYHRRFNPVIFKEMLRIGIPRSLGRCIGIAAWTFSAHILLKKGSDHLLVLTLGTSLFMIFGFINEGFGQAITTIASHVLGAKEDKILPLLFRSSVQMLLLSIVILSIPLIFCREFFVSLFLQDFVSESTLKMLNTTCFCVWIVCISNGINAIGASMVTASRDTLFYALAVGANWITICLPTYLAIDVFDCSPYYFFIIDAANASLLGFIYLFRFRTGKWKKNLISLYGPASAQ